MITQNKDVSLWKLTNEHQKLLNELYDYETGEINELIQAKLDTLEPTIEKKCIAVTQWIRKLESEKRELDAIQEEVESRRHAYDREVKKYSNYLELNMKKQGMTEIKCPFFTVRLRKNPHSTDIIDESLIPQKFIVAKEIVKIESKPDKKACSSER